MGELRACLRCHAEKDIICFPIIGSHAKRRNSAYCRECTLLFRQERREISKLHKEVGKGTDYQSRNKWLNYLGFKDYREYLQSDLWKAVRKRVYAAKGSLCYLCGQPATELHHNRYHKNDLVGNRLKYINPICHVCHEKIEFVDGKKSSVRQAKVRFNKFRRRRKLCQ